MFPVVEDLVRKAAPRGETIPSKFDDALQERLRKCGMGQCLRLFHQRLPISLDLLCVLGSFTSRGSVQAFPVRGKGSRAIPALCNWRRLRTVSSITTSHRAMAQLHHVAIFTPLSVGAGAVPATIFIHALALSAMVNFFRRETRLCGTGMWWALQDSNLRLRQCEGAKRGPDERSKGWNNCTLDTGS